MAKKMSKKGFPLFRTKTFTNTASLGETFHLNVQIPIKNGDSEGKSKIMTQLKTDSLAVCRITSRAQHNSKKPPKVIVTPGQRSLARVLKIAHDGNKTTEV